MARGFRLDALLALCPLVLLGAMGCEPALAAPGEAASGDAAPLPVSLVTNGKDTGELALIAKVDGYWMVRASDLAGQGITIPATAKRVRLGDADFVAIEGQDGLSFELSPDATVLRMTAASRQFRASEVNLLPRQAMRSTIAPAQFLDYNLVVTNWRGATSLAGLVEGGASGRWGVITSNASILTGRDPVRLETAFRHDFSDRRLRLTIGDSVTASAAWSQPLRFGGIAFGSDFSQDAQSVNFPLLTVTGSARLPSTVELITAASRQSLNVGPGNFEVNLRPQFLGAGKVAMVVTDALGNRQQVVRNFYSSTRLLRRNLDQFGIEAGALRRDFGLANARYGPAFAAFGWRHGFNSALTGQTRVEMTGDSVLMGAGADFVIVPLAEFGISGAVSQSGGQRGHLWRVQGQRITPDYSFAASYEQASSGFRQTDVSPLVQSGWRRELSLSGSLSLGRVGNLGLGYIRSRQATGSGAMSALEIGSLSYSVPLLGGQLALAAQAIRHGDSAAMQRDMVLTATFSVALGPARYVAVNADNERFAATLDQRVPDQGGLGYRVLAGRERDQDWLEAGVMARAGFGDFRLDATQRSGNRSLRWDARGSLVRIGSTMLAVPRSGDAFAKVEIASGDKVTVFAENRPLPRFAGKDRPVIVTGLVPYVANHIGVDAEALPIESTLDAATQVVVPGWRQASVLRFGDDHRVGAGLRLVDHTGATLPLGAQATWSGGQSVVAHDGALWFDAYPAGKLWVQANGQTCLVLIPSIRDKRVWRDSPMLECNPYIEARRVL